MVRVGFLFAAIAVPGLFVTIVKHVIGRARPMVGGHIDPFLFSPFSWPAAYASLPSGHATTAFSVLVAFGSLFPRWRTELIIYAGLISLSRIVVNAHHPSDVFAGALVGTTSAAHASAVYELPTAARRSAAQRVSFAMRKPLGDQHYLHRPSLPSCCVRRN